MSEKHFLIYQLLYKNSFDGILDLIHIKTYEDETHIFIEECDNGLGINKENIDKVFDPYFTTKGTRNGSGLGLYMSKMIIKGHHQGKLYIKQEYEDTCFVISLQKDITKK